jgi:Family of unknown function (DUF5670)
LIITRCGAPRAAPRITSLESIMLDTVLIILILLWALGYFGGFVAGNLIHLLLVVALVVFAVRVIQGRPVR